MYKILLPMNSPIVSMDNIKIMKVTNDVGQKVWNPDSVVIETYKVS